MAERRAPQGARGLKFGNIPGLVVSARRRAPQGARGLKFVGHEVSKEGSSRAPQGARGLKFRMSGTRVILMMVAPRKGRVG